MSKRSARMSPRLAKGLACAICLAIVLFVGRGPIWMPHAVKILVPNTTRVQPHAEASLKFNFSSTSCGHVTGFTQLRCLGFEPKFVLDVGANRGDWTRQFLKIFPQASFIMIDGFPHTDEWADLLRSSNVKATVAILDSTEHEVTWYANGGSTGNSIFKEQTHHYEKNVGQKAMAHTLDGLLSKFGWPKPFELVKLDVQGAEIAILAGAPHVLEHAEVMLLELPLAGSYNLGAPSFAGYLRFLDEAGFQPYDTTELHRTSGIAIQIDLIFVRKGSKWAQFAQYQISQMGR